MCTTFLYVVKLYDRSRHRWKKVINIIIRDECTGKNSTISRGWIEEKVSSTTPKHNTRRWM